MVAREEISRELAKLQTEGLVASMQDRLAAVPRYYITTQGQIAIAQNP